MLQHCYLQSYLTIFLLFIIGYHFCAIFIYMLRQQLYFLNRIISHNTGKITEFCKWTLLVINIRNFNLIRSFGPFMMVGSQDQPVGKYAPILNSTCSSARRLGLFPVTGSHQLFTLNVPGSSPALLVIWLPSKYMFSCVQMNITEQCLRTLKLK